MAQTRVFIPLFNWRNWNWNWAYSEKRVLLHFFGVSLSCAEASLGISPQQLRVNEQQYTDIWSQKHATCPKCTIHFHICRTRLELRSHSNVHVSLWRWPLWRGIVGNGLRRWQYCQTPPLHHHLEMETASTETKHQIILQQLAIWTDYIHLFRLYRKRWSEFLSQVSNCKLQLKMTEAYYYWVSIITSV